MTSNAMYEDEAGMADFTIRTAGHDGGTTYVAPLILMNGEKEVVITSSSPPYPWLLDDEGEDDEEEEISRYVGMEYHSTGGSGSSCQVSARDTKSGELLWRRNACSSSSFSSRIKRRRHAVLASSSSSSIYTLDDTGTFRGWNPKDGSLLFDIPSPLRTKMTSYPTTPRISEIKVETIGSVLGTFIPMIGSSGRRLVEGMAFRDPTSGRVLPIHSASDKKELGILSPCDMLQDVGISAPEDDEFECRILDIVSSRRGVVSILASYVVGGVVDLGLMSMVDVRVSLSGGGGAAPATVQVTVDGEEEFESPVKSDKKGSFKLVLEKALPIKVDDEDMKHLTVKASSIRIFDNGDKMDGAIFAMGISHPKADSIPILSIPSNGSSTFIERKEMAELHPLWTSIRSIVPPSFLDEILIVGEDDRFETPKSSTASFLFRYSSIKPHEYERDEEVMYNAIASCGGEIALGFLDDFAHGEEGEGVRSRRIHNVELLKNPRGTVDIPFLDQSSSLLSASMIQCVDHSMTVLVTLTGGSSSMIQVNVLKSKQLMVKELWSSEEALSTISSALFVEELTAPSTDDTDNNNNDATTDTKKNAEELLLQSLTFQNRLYAQMAQTKHFFMEGGFQSMIQSNLFPSSSTIKKKTVRDYSFGFTKIAVLLSSTMNKILGCDTALNGQIVYSLNLNPSRRWHKMVQGGMSRPTGVGGGVHLDSLGNEILVLSGSGEAQEVVDWMCMDGLRGKDMDSASVSLHSRVVQIAPIHLSQSSASASSGTSSSSSGCRQMAVLLLEDNTITVLPNTPQSLDTFLQITKNPKGMFLHTLDRDDGQFSTLRVLPTSPSNNIVGKAVPVGTTTFDPSKERILSINYPQRNEVVQSPSTILGDDSLLLKYLNPHLCVVVTMATDDFLSSLGDENNVTDKDPFFEALGNKPIGVGSDDEKEQTKPVGVTEPGEEQKEKKKKTTPDPLPSLFITLLDTVSGQVLHRVSHSHYPSSSSTNPIPIPVLITENWIIYTYPNLKSRRTELAVLTLHEGMIDKNGITAFNTLDQDRFFSSLTTPPPVVLAKSFVLGGVSGAVTALGVTNTRGGISSKFVLLGTGVGGRVESVDRRMLDPRRPNGELKQSEKDEGLVRYNPLIPLVTLRTPSYTHRIESITHITSASAHVESQSLVLAFGGPDVFFTRMAPSRGFDLLPESFNRLLLTIVVVGLVVVVVVLRKMANGKTMALGWS